MVMNERIEHCLYQAGLTAQGCWEDLDTYTQEGIEKFALLIVRECMRMCDCADVSYLEHGCDKEASGAAGAKKIIKEWFEVEE
jgi:hypothetical protein